MKYLNFIFLLILLLPTSSCAKEDNNMIREPAVSGQFYPKDKSELTKMVNGFLASAKNQNIESRIIGLIAPHAGYVFSGQTAA